MVMLILLAMVVVVAMPGVGVIATDLQVMDIVTLMVVRAMGILVMDLAITVVQRGKATITVTATTDMAKAETTMAIIVMVTMEIMVTGMVTVVTGMVTKVQAMVNRLMGAREAAIETRAMEREAAMVTKITAIKIMAAKVILMAVVAMARDLIILAMVVEPMIMAIMVITDIPDMASIMTLVKNQITAVDTKIIIK